MWFVHIGPVSSLPLRSKWSKFIYPLFPPSYKGIMLLNPKVILVRSPNMTLTLKWPGQVYYHFYLNPQINKVYFLHRALFFLGRLQISVQQIMHCYYQGHWLWPWSWNDLEKSVLTRYIVFLSKISDTEERMPDILVGDFFLLFLRLPTVSIAQCWVFWICQY